MGDDTTGTEEFKGLLRECRGLFEVGHTSISTRQMLTVLAACDLLGDAPNDKRHLHAILPRVVSGRPSGMLSLVEYLLVLEEVVFPSSPPEESDELSAFWRYLQAQHVRTWNDVNKQLNDEGLNADTTQQLLEGLEMGNRVDESTFLDHFTLKE